MKFSDINKRIVISCKSVESETRRANIDKLLTDINGIEYEAFAGKLNDIHSSERDVIHRSEVGRGAVSLYLTHLAIWQTYQNEDYIAVFESDAKLIGNLESVELPNINFIYLDYQTTDEFMGKKMKSMGNLNKDVVIPIRPLRTHAYVISGKGMKKMLGRRVKCNKPFDWALLDYLLGNSYGGLKERNIFTYIEDVSTIMINGIKQ